MMPLRFITVFLLLTLLAGCSSFVLPPGPARSPLETKGRSVFKSYCSRCHETSGDTVVVGPSLAGIATRGSSRVAGMDAETYIRDSILTPNAYIVEGFPENVMPATLQDEMSPEEVEAVVVFLLTLK